MTRRSVVAFLASSVCVSTASGMAVVALGKLVYDLTGDEFDLGLLGLAEFAPAALLVFVSGPIADRHDRRHVVALSAVLEATSMLGLAGLVVSGVRSTAPIFALVVAFGTFRAFMAPAARALPSDIVAPSELSTLVARYALSWQLSLIIGPVVGGFLYAVDPAAPFVGVATLLVLGACAISLIPGERTRVHHDDLDAPKLTDAFEGLRFIRSRPVLLGAISLDLFAVLFGGAVALLPAIAEDRLGVGPIGLGWLRAAVGIGAGLTTVVLALRPIQGAIGRVLLSAVAVFGIFTVVLGITHDYVVAFVALAILSGADAISVYIRATLVPLLTPVDRRGRVLAVENVFIGASNELGGFESGAVAAAVSTPFAVVSGGVATLVVAVVWWFRFPALRTLERFPDNIESDAIDLRASG
jgi:MFS family permease